jgi:hypothetical protein
MEAVMQNTHLITPQAVKEKEAATYIGMSVAFLRQSRINGNRKNRTPAPPFVKAGRAVIYMIADLDSWLQKNRVELNAACE